MVMVDVRVVVLVMLPLGPSFPPTVTDGQGDFVPAMAMRAKDRMVRSVEKRMFLKLYERTERVWIRKN